MQGRILPCKGGASCLERIYQALCPNNDETCKATVRKALNALVRQGLMEKHRKARNKKEYRSAEEYLRI